MDFEMYSTYHNYAPVVCIFSAIYAFTKSSIYFNSLLHSSSFFLDCIFLYTLYFITYSLNIT